MTDLTQQEWIEKTTGNTNAIILDVRTTEEVEEGIIPNALISDIYNPQEFMQTIEQLDKKSEVYVYCRSGARSAQACQIMDQMGFDSTFNLTGGFNNWTGETSTL